MVSKPSTTREYKAQSSQTDEVIRWFDTLTSQDTALVGGKNASLGEMVQTLKEKEIRVPNGFATTANAYWRFLRENDLENRIQDHLDTLSRDENALEQVGKAIRKLFYEAEMPEDVANEIKRAYRELGERYNDSNVDVATRSSATAEDLPEASFAGQQETFLNVHGEKAVVEACKKCYASLFTDRAISYREKNGFDHMKVALSVGVQKMVRSDKAGAGVMFSIDTETGFPNAVLINAGWGLGETVVQGSVTPDEYMVFKTPLKQGESLKPIISKTLGAKEKKIVYATGGSHPTKTINTSRQERQRFVLNDEEILQLARWAVTIEEHYGKAMDMEWAKDGESGKLFIVQARPETVQSQKEKGVLKTYSLKETGNLLLTGQSVGSAIASGKAFLIRSTDEMDKFEEGGILVTEMTEPDWVPIIRKAAAIVTDTGGRTSHAAIVSREYGIPAVIGTGKGTDTFKDGQEITVSCAEGDQGKIYEGQLKFEAQEARMADLPKVNVQLMLNIGNPSAAFRWWQLPVQGIGLARMEFIIGNIIKVHPMALVNFDAVKDEKTRQRIEDLTRGYEEKPAYFVEHLARGIAKIAASQHPHDVIVRMSDFKSNEYANLIGGEYFEPEENNPMLGFRGACRYYSEDYKAGFALECQAIKRAREEIGLDNIIIMIPFCRTLKEADRVLEVLAENGLKRGERGLQIYMMAELPSNIVLAEQFAERFDGFSIGSNDLTQLTLGVDRDSEKLSELFDETDPSIQSMISELIEKAHRTNTKVGICGQAPSDYPDFAAFLVQKGINSLSLNPDSFLSVVKQIAESCS